MNQQEQSRLQVLNSVLEYQLPIAQAAEIMGVGERHTKRLLAAYRKDGAAALAHGNRGRKPHNAVPEPAAAAVVKLASNGYAGANHSHFTELLREREGIDLSRPTVRRILVKAGIGSPRSRRSQQHRFRRRRMPQEGMLVQIDGSQHPWLEDRGPKLTLLIAVDDATRHRGPGGISHHRGHSRLPGALGGPSIRPIWHCQLVREPRQDATLGIDEGLWDVRWSWCRRSTESGWQHRKRDGSGR